MNKYLSVVAGALLCISGASNAVTSSTYPSLEFLSEFSAEDLQLVKGIVYKDVSVVREALRSGSDANLRAHNGTVLHLAIEFGFIEGVETLLDHGSDVNHMIRKGFQSALTMARQRGDQDIIELLLAYDVADPYSKMLSFGKIPKRRGVRIDRQRLRRRYKEKLKELGVF